MKVGSDESHFNGSLILRDKVKDGVLRQILKRKESRSGFEPLGQTGSRASHWLLVAFIQRCSPLSFSHESGALTSELALVPAVCAMTCC